MRDADKARIKACAREVLESPYGDERLGSWLGCTDYEDIIRPIIAVVAKVRCPQGLPMHIKSQQEWGWIAEAVNVGIDSRLEGFTKSTFDASTGRVLVHPDEMGILVHRLEEKAMALSNEHYEECPDWPCDAEIHEELSEREAFISDILSAVCKKDEN